jgi:hypothetical protein
VKDAYMRNTKFRRTRLGVCFMLVSMVLGMAVAVASLLSMRGHLDTDAMAGPTLSLPTILISLFSPVGILLEIVALVLILLNSREIGVLHRRLAWTALWLFIVWGAANLGGFLPLTFIAVQRGSVAMLRMGQMVKAIAAVFQYAVPFLLIFGIAPPSVKRLLWPALVLTIVGNFATVALGGASMELVASDASGFVSHVPRLAVDYTRGVYPFTLGMGYIGGFLYILAYGSLLARFGYNIMDDGKDNLW